MEKELKSFPNVIEARKAFNYKIPVSGVYAFINDEKKLVYFGSTKNLYKRFSSHKNDFINKHGLHPGLHKLFDKKGISNVPVEIVFEDTKNEYSINFIRKLENIIMRSFMHVGYTVLSNSKGCISDEYRAKLTAAHTGKVLSDEHKLKIGERLRGEKSPNFGKPMDEKIKKKLSKLQGTPIIAILPDGTQKKFCSYNEAAKELKIYHTTISDCINQNRKLRNGIQFFKINKHEQ